MTSAARARDDETKDTRDATMFKKIVRGFDEIVCASAAPNSSTIESWWWSLYNRAPGRPRLRQMNGGHSRRVIRVVSHSRRASPSSPPLDLTEPS